MLIMMSAVKYSIGFMCYIYDNKISFFLCIYSKRTYIKLLKDAAFLFTIILKNYISIQSINFFCK